MNMTLKKKKDSNKMNDFQMKTNREKTHTDFLSSCTRGSKSLVMSEIP